VPRLPHSALHLDLFEQPALEFSLTDGLVTIIRRKPERAFEVAGGAGTGTGQVTGQVGERVVPPVAPPVEFLLRLLILTGVLGNAEIRSRLGLKDRTRVMIAVAPSRLVTGS
jgi:hypothetical protein